MHGSAVTAEGQFPAPLITGKKGDRFLVRQIIAVSSILCRDLPASILHQLNVIDQLNDTSMRRATSIVSLLSIYAAERR